MASTQLPNETLCTIFEYLPPPALPPVLRASHRFRLVAERVLYASIFITEALPRIDSLLLPPDVLPALHPPYTRTRACAETILARPHLAEAVRRLTVRWQTADGPREPYLPAAAPALAALNRALRTLAHLEHLDLALGLVGAPALGPRAVLAGCALPALRAFALSGLGRGALSPKLHPRAGDAEDRNGAALAAFLAGAPGLAQLHLHDCHDALAVPAGALRHLQAFRGPALAAAGVLPGRPVRTLALVGHEFITEGDLAGVARASVPVQWLDLSGMSVTPLLLRDVSRHLPCVEVLKVRLALRHTLHHALSGISLLAGLSQVLGAFPALAQLDLSATPLDGVGRGNALEESALCTTWARACPALRRVVFPSKTEWRRDPGAPELWLATAGTAVWTRY